METKKVLSALSYFSLLFAGFIFPLVVFLASEDKEVKYHAKRAFLSHLIPLITVPIILITLFIETTSNNIDIPYYTIGAAILSSVVGIIVLIWNIVKGVKVLTEK
jgi:uncharacterized membrane protein